MEEQNHTPGLIDWPSHSHLFHHLSGGPQSPVPWAAAATPSLSAKLPSGPGAPRAGGLAGGLDGWSPAQIVPNCTNSHGAPA